MRIVAGQFRGRPLAAPATARTRPTSDRVRESVFNILEHGIADFSLAGVARARPVRRHRRAGLEALSRGAAFCLFVEEDAAARGLIRRNIEALGAHRHHQGVPPRCHRSGPCGQPRRLRPRRSSTRPTRRAWRRRALASAAAGGWLAPGAVAVIEESRRAAIALPPGFTALEQRTWGDTQVLFARLRDRPEPGVRPSGSDTVTPICDGAMVSDPEGLTPLTAESCVLAITLGAPKLSGLHASTMLLVDQHRSLTVAV